MSKTQSVRIGARWESARGVIQVACEIPLNQRSEDLSRQSRGLKQGSQNPGMSKSLPDPRGPGARMLPRPEDK